MQTDLITSTRSSWPEWARFLRQRGLEDMTSWILEALGPLTVLAAQILLLTAPLMRPAFSPAFMDTLSNLLDDPSESRAFAAYLREDASQ